MQIGTRWVAGQSPTQNLPQEMLDSIKEIEREAGITSTPTVNGPCWTLTWMERRPICTLDSGVELTIGQDGEVLRADESETKHISDFSDTDNDDWLKS
jgi:hypothetical protein